MLISMYKGLNLFATMQTKFQQMFLTHSKWEQFCETELHKRPLFTPNIAFPT